MPGVTNTSHFNGSACELAASFFATLLIDLTLEKSRIGLKDENAANPAIASDALSPEYNAEMHRVGFLVVGDFQIMSCAAVAVFDVANIFAGRRFYEVRTISERGGVARSSVGVAIETARLSGSYDTLLVAGPTAIAPSSQRVLTYLRREATKSRRVASICTGAFVLAEAGILDGRRATTHWLYTRELQDRYPNVRVVEDRIFTHDGRVWTSAGMTAGIDLALALVESDLGVDIARQVAKGLVMYLRRSGAQGQESALLSMAAQSDRIQTALSYARQNLRSELSVEELAAAAHLSVRQFSRAFRQETGQSPAKAVEALRAEVARVMLEEGSHSAEELANATGFGNRERMRRAFVRVFGRPPQELRRDGRDDLRAPDVVPQRARREPPRSVRMLRSSSRGH